MLITGWNSDAVADVQKNKQKKVKRCSRVILGLQRVLFNNTMRSRSDVRHVKEVISTEG